jgi:thiol-disulfide isomerase/thioredoxin
LLVLALFIATAHGHSNPGGKSQAANTKEPFAHEPGEQKPPAYPFGDVSRWLPRVKSFHLRVETRFESSPDRIAKNLRELKRQFPDLKDPDPFAFSELLPVTNVIAESTFDRSRLRLLWLERTPEGRDRSRRIGFWDGKRGLAHEEYFPSKQNSFRLSPKPDWVAQNLFTYVTYLSRQPPVFWRNDNPEAKKTFEKTSGTPSDYVLVDRQMYHGVDCHVFLSSVGNQSDRFYVGVNDGRWYGAKEGIIAALPDTETFVRTHQRTVEEFLGTKLGDKVSDAEWDKINDTLWSLAPDKKVAWCRLHYSREAKDHVPCFEYWFSDFSDLGGGRFFPYREQLLFYNYDRDEKKVSINPTRTLVVKEIAIDGPLGDDLFHEPFAEGAIVADDTHQPPLIYKYKAKFTAEEWEAIVKSAQKRHDADALQQRQVREIIGKPAPPLPNGEWLNSKPLTWADLRGKIVVLKFWAINCGPCYGQLSALRAPAKLQHPTDQAQKNGAPAPIVFIGVHAPGSSKEEIEKVVAKHKLAAPICIDQKGADASSWAEFFVRCRVNAMPTSVAVDEQGRILAHGVFSEVFTAAAERQRLIPRSENK